MPVRTWSVHSVKSALGSNDSSRLPFTFVDSSGSVSVSNTLRMTMWHEMAQMAACGVHGEDVSASRP